MLAIVKRVVRMQASSDRQGLETYLPKILRYAPYIIYIHKHGRICMQIGMICIALIDN